MCHCDEIPSRNDVNGRRLIDQHLPEENRKTIKAGTLVPSANKFELNDADAVRNLFKKQYRAVDTNYHSQPGSSR